MPKCKLCGAAITFIKSPAGKFIPVDPKLVKYSRGLVNSDRVVTQTGTVVACEIQKYMSAPMTVDIGYIPHWATCKGKLESVRKKRTPQEERLF